MEKNKNRLRYFIIKGKTPEISGRFTIHLHIVFILVS